MPIAGCLALSITTLSLLVPAHRIEGLTANSKVAIFCDGYKVFWCCVAFGGVDKCQRSWCSS